MTNKIIAFKYPGIKNLVFFVSLIICGFAIPKVFASESSSLSISQPTTNSGSYPGGTVPKYEKFEITFQINGSTAQNYQLPYDSNPPAGIESGTGITVNARFTPDNWQTVYTIPAFYYEEYLDEIKSNNEWFYPTGNYFWKVRFTPSSAGSWKYKITIEDSSGTFESGEYSFNVSNSANPGFIRVSSKDPRYFEFENGQYFPALGYNMNYNHIDWVSPVLRNQSNFESMGDNGIQLIRIWLSEWSIFGSGWNPWYGVRNDHDGYIPRTGLTIYGSDDPVSAQMTLGYGEDASGNKNTSWYDACRFIGGQQARAAVKQNTKYHIRIRYKTTGVSGPRNVNYSDYGLVAKIQNPTNGNWHTTCYEPGEPQNGIKVSYTYGKSEEWAYLEGEWNSGNNNFLPNFYLALENVNALNPQTGTRAYAYIDTVFVGEDLGNNSYGPNIITKPSMEHHKYFMQRNSYAFDKVLDLAEENGVYIRPVILEKNDDIQNFIGSDGKQAPSSNNNFYGNGQNITYIRWYQMAWWRYLQARWGYSTSIHSWELLNEGDPNSTRHSSMADAFAQYMHQFRPNDHLVSTSNWHSYPAAFWNNCPNCDFTDVHRYVDKETNSSHFYDTSMATYEYSNNIFQTKQSGGINKPVIRGETGFTNSGTGPASEELLADTQGIWLHNFIWGGVNPGALIESYWYENVHIYNSNDDHRNQYLNYYNFIKDIPLNNGNYTDAQADISNSDIRAWGQKDLVNKRAHLWISNRHHTWSNVVNGSDIPELSGTVTIKGFDPNTQYRLENWNTYTGTITAVSNITSDTQGDITIQVNSLNNDYAIRIGNYDIEPTPTPTPTPFPGDANNDGKVDGLDYVVWLTHYNTNVSGAQNGDFNNSGRVDGLDYVIWLNNYTR